jgi:hypothetical protein
MMKENLTIRTARMEDLKQIAGVIRVRVIK